MTYLSGGVGRDHWEGALAVMSRDFLRCRFVVDGLYRRMGHSDPG